PTGTDLSTPPANSGAPEQNAERVPSAVDEAIRRYAPGGDRYEAARALERGAEPSSRNTPAEPRPRTTSPPPTTSPENTAPDWIREVIERYRAGGPRSGTGGGERRDAM